MLKKILLIGDPRLRIKCTPVDDYSDPEFIDYCNLLKDTLDEFRRINGFGRAIAAPQIGIPKRFIAFNQGNDNRIIINPVVTWHCEESFTLWDDCMSLPDLLVKVKRFKSVSISYLDEMGTKQTWDDIKPDLSELFQHEIDHLDGILMVDRAISSKDIIYKKVYKQNRKYFNRQVDYSPV